MRDSRFKVLRSLSIALLLAASALPAMAGGPRFVTGPPYFTTAGQPVPFYTATPLYFTDPGALSASVRHAQADAMVAAAAAVWTTPTSMLLLSQGGLLAEHVSTANSYFDGNGIVFPADVQPTNYQARPIAVIYDTDGSVTDLLLGSGASDPSGCRQSGVTENVDAIDPAGVIDHAVIVLNGRCVAATDTATSTLQLKQMQYQLMRAFGRVMGIGWSQLNDNVFTGVPTPTAANQSAWPLMHPIDIVCGPYTFQCMPNPFTLRMDDLSTLALLYPVTTANVVAGKTLSLTHASAMYGTVAFPNGQGMETVNVEFLRQPFGGAVEAAYCVSVVAGSGFREMNGNPISGPPVGLAESAGTTLPDQEGWFLAARVALIDGLDYNFVWAHTELINPLYTGEYAVGPYVGTPMALSGASLTVSSDFVSENYPLAYALNEAAATPACNVSGDGTETAPSAFDSSGFLTSQICGYGHSSWRALNVKAGHSWALEVTALDENGIATGNKLQPVLGVWKSTDAAGQLPTVAAVVAPLNSALVGTTQLAVPASASDAALRLAIADMRGAGRPDFAYSARVLYADSVTPPLVSTSGGAITVMGMGFRNGNQVLVNGVAATVTSWSANAIVVTAPSMSSVDASDGSPVEVVVTDLTTGSTATLPAAFAYSASVNPVRAVSTSAPSRYLAAGSAASWTMSVLATQNGSPAAGVTVNWSADSGVQLSAAASITDANGVATVIVTTSGLISGASVNVQGCAWTTQCASTTANGIDASQWRLGVASGGAQSVRVGAAPVPMLITATDAAGHALQGAPVQIYQTVTAWQGACPAQGRCPSAPVIASSQSAAVSDNAGSLVVTPLVVPNTAGVTHIAVATGTQAFVTASVNVMP